jgi:hypothetical protein
MTPNKPLTPRCFRFLCDAGGGRLSEVARRAEIGEAAAYEWSDRFLGPADRAGGP